jgi:hypothetical protein
LWSVGPTTLNALNLCLVDAGGRGCPQTILKARTFGQEIPKVGELVELGVVGRVVVFSPQPKAR